MNTSANQKAVFCNINAPFIVPYCLDEKISMMNWKESLARLEISNSDRSTWRWDINIIFEIEITKYLDTLGRNVYWLKREKMSWHHLSNILKRIILLKSWKIPERWDVLVCFQHMLYATWSFYFSWKCCYGKTIPWKSDDRLSIAHRYFCISLIIYKVV